MKDSYVYLMESADRKVIKIGYTVDPRMRLVQMSSAGQCNVGAAKMRFVGLRVGGRAEESAMLALARKHGKIAYHAEWFKWSRRLLARLRPEFPLDVRKVLASLPAPKKVRMARIACPELQTAFQDYRFDRRFNSKAAALNFLLRFALKQNPEREEKRADV